MSSVLLLARFLLALVFAAAGLAKLADLAGSRQALRDFGMPAALPRSLGVLLPLTELAVAVALLPPAIAWWGALGALILLLLFVAAERDSAPGVSCGARAHGGMGEVVGRADGHCRRRTDRRILG